jgi:C-8 sterol isomerase
VNVALKKEQKKIGLIKRTYLFDPVVLDEIRRKGIGKPIPEAFSVITEELARVYPGHICTKHNWMFNNAGGAMGQLNLLHGSLSEYLIFFGTCIGTEGHSGRYASDVFDFMIQGEMLCEYEGRFEPEAHTIHTPPAYLGSKVIKHYSIKKDAWMLEYCRGSVPRMFPFGIADSLFSTLDIRTVARLIRQYAFLTIRALMRGKDLALLMRMVLFLAAIGIVVWQIIAYLMQ